jgi:hypothetical protein
MMHVILLISWGTMSVNSLSTPTLKNDVLQVHMLKCSSLDGSIPSRVEFVFLLHR